MSDEEILDDVPENETPDAAEAEPVEPTDIETEAPAPEQAPQATVWDAFRALPDFQGQDERAIAQRLYQSLEREKQATHALAQYRQVLPVAQQYLQHRPEFEKWLAQQQQPQQAPAPQAAPKQEAGWWNPPQLRDAYKRYIVKDETGRDSIHPDAPLDAKHAITEYFQYKQDFAERFLNNPEEALAPMVTKLAQQQAAEIVNSQLEQAGRAQYVQTLEQQNRDWLYDQSGNVSPEGERARNYIEQARAMGISSPEARWQYALQMVERDLLHSVQAAQASQSRQQVFQQQLDSVRPPAPAAPAAPARPQQSQAEANMDFLRRAASRTANRAGVQTNSPEQATRGMSFEEQLRSTLSERGLI
jgi:hypothetical protein